MVLPSAQRRAQVNARPADVAVVDVRETMPIGLKAQDIANEASMMRALDLVIGPR